MPVGVIYHLLDSVHLVAIVNLLFVLHTLYLPELLSLLAVLQCSVLLFLPLNCLIHFSFVHKIKQQHTRQYKSQSGPRPECFLRHLS